MGIKPNPKKKQIVQIESETHIENISKKKQKSQKNEEKKVSAKK